MVSKTEHHVHTNFNKTDFEKTKSYIIFKLSQRGYNTLEITQHTSNIHFEQQNYELCQKSLLEDKFHSEKKQQYYQCETDMLGRQSKDHQLHVQHLQKSKPQHEPP